MHSNPSRATVWLALSAATAILAGACGDADDGVNGGPSRVAHQTRSIEPTQTTDSSDDLCDPPERSNKGDGEVTVGSVTRDPKGPNSKARLNDEVVTLTSSSAQTVDLTGWTITDRQGVAYEFPSGSSICRYKVISVHSGRGENTGVDYFADWGWRWDDHGDVVILREADGNLVAKCQYGAVESALRC